MGSTSANTILCFYEKKWLENCPPEFKPVFYRKCVDDIFVLFKSADDLVKFRNYFNNCHLNNNFHLSKKKW